MTVLLFILVLIVLVLAHEYGHFLSAKFFGMKVEEFGIGFPPRLWGIKKGETLYSLNLLPLGGFVKILGERGEEESNPQSYASRPPWQRAIVLISGVMMNFLLAVMIFWVVFSIGYPTVLEKNDIPQASNHSIQVLSIAKGSPAQGAGIERGDAIINVKAQMSNVKTPLNVEELQTIIKENKGRLLTLTIQRGGMTLEKQVLARNNPPQGEGAIGIALADIGLVKFPWYKAFLQAWVWAARSFWFILSGLYLLLAHLFFQGKFIGEVSGPVGIASMVGEFYALGISYFLAFVGSISLNLSVLNILPIPALDGGRLFFVAIEKIKGSPLKPAYEDRIHTIGFALLLSLLVFVTIHDILTLL